jgi:hypothetical protein
MGSDMNQNDIIAALKEQRPLDKFEAMYGPTRIAGSTVWEVWVNYKGEFETRFVEEVDGKVFAIYDSFQSIALRLDDMHRELMTRLQDAERDRTMRLAEQQSRLASEAADRTSKRMTAMIRDIRTAGAFAISLMVFSYLLINGANPWPATIMFACVLASACAFFYGKFVTVKASDLVSG